MCRTCADADVFQGSSLNSMNGVQETPTGVWHHLPAMNCGMPNDARSMKLWYLRALCPSSLRRSNKRQHSVKCKMLRWRLYDCISKLYNRYKIKRRTITLPSFRTQFLSSRSGIILRRINWRQRLSSQATSVWISSMRWRWQQNPRRRARTFVFMVVAVELGIRRLKDSAASVIIK